MSEQRHPLHPQHDPINPSPPPLPAQPPSPKRVNEITTTSGSSSNRPPSRKHPLYRGIRSRRGKWVSEIREPRTTKRIWLGSYPSPEMAAAAFDVAALALKGREVALNFPDHIASFPVPASSAPEDVRRAAAAAAHMMRQYEAVDDEPWRSNETAGDAEVMSGGGDRHGYIDEEELFYMPNLLMDMAEGMLMSPPRMASLPPADEWPDVFDGDNLWSYY